VDVLYDNGLESLRRTVKPQPDPMSPNIKHVVKLEWIGLAEEEGAARGRREGARHDAEDFIYGLQ